MLLTVVPAINDTNVVFVGNGMADNLYLRTSGTGELEWSQNGSDFASLGVDSAGTHVSVDLGGSDDVVVLRTLSVDSLTVVSSDGQDALRLEQNQTLTAGLVDLAAETIHIEVGATLDSSAAVTLAARATDSSQATVLVDGTITAPGHVRLAAEVARSASEQGLVSLNSTTLAQTAVRDGAVIQAASLEVLASTEAQLTVTAEGVTTGSVNINSTQQTLAQIDGGASVTVGTAAISADEPVSLLVSAIDSSQISTDIQTTAVDPVIGFDSVTSNISLSRDTQAYIGSGFGQATVTGQNGAAAGMVKIIATNQDGELDGVAGRIESNFVGVHTNAVTKDDVRALVRTANLDVEALQVTATNSASYVADAKIAKNVVTGVTEALIDNSTVTANPVSADQGVLLSAVDQSSHLARSGDFQMDVDDFLSELQSGVELGKASAINEIEKNTTASIQNSAETITVTNGDVVVEALSEMRISGTAEALAISDTSDVLPTLNLNVAGTLAANEVRGDVRAFIIDSQVTASGADGDVQVRAANRTAVDALAEASTAASGGINATFGASVAFNAIGWDLGNIGAATLNALIGTELAAIEEQGGSEAEAYLQNSRITAGADVTVEADAAAKLNATVSNVSASTGEALFGAAGVGIGGVVASNRVGGGAHAYVKEIDAAQALDAGGDLTVRATDSTGIFANTKIITSQYTTNDGGVGVLNDLAASFVPAIYQTSRLTPETSTKALNFGDTVGLAFSFDEELGTPGRVYQYMGQGGTAEDERDLLAEDYYNLDLWKELLVTRVQHGGLNLTDSDSAALGGTVVRNEVAGAVEAYIEQAEVAADSVTVVALEEAQARAIVDLTAESSGGSSFGSGESIAAQGALAVNSVISSTDAFIVDSRVTARDGDVVVEASNESRLFADTRTSLTSEGNTYGFVVAFNTLGYRAQNLLFDSFDALLGGDPSVFGNEAPVRVHAYINDSEIQATGDLRVSAESLAEIEALTSNDSTASGAAVFGTESKTIAGVLASNKVSTDVKAYVDFDLVSGTRDVLVGGDLSVEATDRTAVDATTRMVATALKVNDLGLGAVNDLYNILIGDYAYTTNSGVRDLVFGDQVRLDDVDYSTDDPPSEIVKGDWVELASEIGGGQEGEVYEYLGDDPLEGTGLSGQLDFSAEDFSQGDRWRKINGSPGTVYQYMGAGGDPNVDQRDLATEDFNDFVYWKELSENNVIPPSLSTALLKDNDLETGESQSYYGVISRNDLKSAAAAYIDHARVRGYDDVTSGPASITVSALEAARMTATDTSLISSNTEGKGGVITNNQFRSSADAYITHSDLLTSHVTANSGSGDVNVTARNLSQVIATSDTRSQSRDSVGAVVSFNSVGWDSADIFFQTLEVLLGNGALVADQPARAHAYMVDTTVDAAGDVRVTAESLVTLDATTGNQQKSTPTNSFVIDSKFGTKSMSAGGMLATNKLSSDAQAYINFSNDFTGDRTITAGGLVEISARDEGGITAQSDLAVTAIATNNLDALYDVAVTLGLDNYEYTTASGNQTVVGGAILGKGTRVRLADDYRGPQGEDYGAGGAVYEYIGLDPIFETLDLGSEDYHRPVWQKVTLGLDDARINIGNLSDSPASAYGGLVVMNDVRRRGAGPP